MKFLCSCGGGDTTTREIDREISKNKKELQNDIKMLLLGSAESGKSTVQKQMKIINLNGFSGEELEAFKPAIHNSIVSSILTILQFINISNLPRHIQEQADLLNEKYDVYFNEYVDNELGDILQSVWEEKKIKDFYFNSQNTHQLSDGANHFLDSIGRITSDDYVPTQEDILRVRIRTTGVNETHFGVSDLNFTVLDVGGQRSERKKWTRCFTDVTAIIFCVSISSYNQVLSEDGETNRLTEDLALWEWVTSNEDLKSAIMILFLNKTDLFKQKIKKIPISKYFPEFTGNTKSYDETSSFVKKKFEKLAPKKIIYSHHTIATDTENITLVFNDVKNAIINASLSRAGI